MRWASGHRFLPNDAYPNDAHYGACGPVGMMMALFGFMVGRRRYGMFARAWSGVAIVPGPLTMRNACLVSPSFTASVTLRATQ